MALHDMHVDHMA